MELDDYDSARTIAITLRDNSLTRAAGLVTLAQCDLHDPEKGKIPQAIQYCEEAIVVAPDYLLAYQVKAFALLASRRYRDAITFLLGTIRATGQHPDLELALAASYAAMADFAEAERHLEIALASADPDTKHAQYADFQQTINLRWDNLQSADARIKEGEEFKMGCGFWAGVIGGTLAPPHFWGVLVLIIGLILKAKGTSDQNKERHYRETKGIGQEDITQSRYLQKRACMTCAFREQRQPFFGEAHSYCRKTKFGLRLTPDTELQARNPCNGRFFISLPQAASSRQ